MKVKVELNAKWELTHALEIEVDQEIFNEWCKEEGIREDDPEAMDEFLARYCLPVDVSPKIPAEWGPAWFTFEDMGYVAEKLRVTKMDCQGGAITDVESLYKEE